MKEPLLNYVRCPYCEGNAAANGHWGECPGAEQRDEHAMREVAEMFSSRKEPMPTERKQLIFRVEADLHDAITLWAMAEHRSVNQQITHSLTAHVPEKYVAMAKQIRKDDEA